MNLNMILAAYSLISRDISTHASVDAIENDFPLLTSNLPTDQKITNNLFVFDLPQKIWGDRLPVTIPLRHKAVPVSASSRKLNCFKKAPRDVATPAAWFCNGESIPFGYTHERYWSDLERMKTVYAKNPKG